MRHAVPLFLLFVLTLSTTVRADGAPAAGTALRQVAGVLDYIAGDYRGAVDANGAVLDQAEYDEQLSLVGDADGLAGQAGIAPSGAARKSLAELKAALERKATPAEIESICRSTRALLVEQHGLVLGPSAAPSRSLGETLYRAQGCPTCHGEDGSADTEAAKKLDPAPANFRDAERVATVSAHRAYYAITFGVAGTGMTGFGHLSDHARWSMAFYVLSMRHDAAQAARGKLAIGLLSTTVPTDAAALAGQTEEDLQKKVSALAEPARRAEALAYLRAIAPFEAAQVDGKQQLARARDELREGLAAFEQGQRGEARRRFVAAYLDGFEPYEAAIAGRDAQLVRDIEREMLALREHAKEGSPAEARQSVDRIERLFDRAEGARGDGNTALFGALAITLREGLEAVLLAGALLLLVRKRGAPELVRYVHAGWIAALALGALTFVVAGHALSGMQRELAEGIAALLAAAVLLGVTHWLLGQATAQRFMGMLSAQLERFVSGGRAGLGVFALSFIAVYREAFEVVLFFQALLLDAGDARDRVWLGAGLGIAALLVTAVVLRAVGQRLKPRPLMLASSVLLAVLSFSLAGKGVRALQEAGVVSMHVLGSFELPVLGVYATLEGLAVQGLLLIALLLSAAGPALAARRDAARA